MGGARSSLELRRGGDSDHYFQIQGHGEKGLDREARPRLTSGRGRLEREIDQGAMLLELE
jgi:hypothetical protein